MLVVAEAIVVGANPAKRCMTRTNVFHVLEIRFKKQFETRFQPKRPFRTANFLEERARFFTGYFAVTSAWYTVKSRKKVFYDNMIKTYPLLFLASKRTKSN